MVTLSITHAIKNTTKATRYLGSMPSLEDEDSSLAFMNSDEGWRYDWEIGAIDLKDDVAGMRDLLLKAIIGWKAKAEVNELQKKIIMAISIMLKGKALSDWFHFLREVDRRDRN